MQKDTRIILVRAARKRNTLRSVHGCSCILHWFVVGVHKQSVKRGTGAPSLWCKRVWETKLSSGRDSRGSPRAPMIPQPERIVCVFEKKESTVLSPLYDKEGDGVYERESLASSAAPIVVGLLELVVVAALLLLNRVHPVVRSVE